MTPFLIGFLQIAFVLIAARYAKECVASIVHGMQTKSFAWKKAPYRRSSAWQSVLMLGALLTLAAVLPLSGEGGLALLDGNVVTVLALLMLVAGTASMMHVKSTLSQIACGMSGVVIALFLASPEGGAQTPASIMALVAFAAVLMTFRVAEATEPETLRDGNTVFFAILAIWFVRLLAPALPSLSSTTVPAAQSIGMGVLLAWGSVTGVLLVREGLFWIWTKTRSVLSPRILIALSLVLSLASVVTSVWMME